jgi:cell division protein FtsB
MRVARHLDATLKRYVLGELDEQPRLEFEERLVVDPELFELLGPTEDELVEEYLEDVLSPAERARFERHFLTNEDRRWHLEFVQLLKDRASAMVPAGPEQTALSSAGPGVQRGSNSVDVAKPVQPQPYSGVTSWAILKGSTGLLRLRSIQTRSLTALMAVLVAGNVWFAFRGRNAGTELVRLRAENQAEQSQFHNLQMQAAQLAAETQALQAQVKLLESQRQRETSEVRAPSLLTERLQPSRTPVPMFVLSPGLLRSEGAVTRIVIPSDTQLIGLRLDLAGTEYSLYRAVLYDAVAEEIWAQSKLIARTSAGRGAVIVVLPSELLSRGDYQLKLSGINRVGVQQSVAAYSFRVTTP